MKTISIVLFTTCLLFQIKTNAQFDGYTTHYYDYFSALAYSHDVAEDMVIDNATDNIYVAGERAKETNLQDIEIIKYKSNGDGDSVYKTYSNPDYKEYVKKILWVNDRLFIICNAVNISADNPTLLILKYNAKLELVVSSFYLNRSFYTPEDVAADENGNLYILCYSRSGSSSALAVVKVNSSLSFLDSEVYYYQSLSDTYQEIPKCIHYNSTEGYIYVGGGVVNPLNNTSAALLLKYTASGPNLTWKKVSTLQSGRNIYNSVAPGSTKVFAVGSANNALVLRHYSYDGNNSKAVKYNGSSAAYNANEGLKITSVTGVGALVVG